MRIAINHSTRYTYDSPAKSVAQVLRLTPRNHEGQTVLGWRVEIDQDSSLRAGEDAFGNVIHVLTLPGPLDALTIALEGEVQTIDTDGVVRDAVERFPPRLYLRETPLTTPTEALGDYAALATKGAIGTLNRLHALLAAVHRDIVFDTVMTDVATTAVEAFALKRGVCQDLSHIFIVCARILGIPARYVGGHLYRTDGAIQQSAGHAWAEAFVEDLGWIGFDPANGISVTEAHVRVAAGLDYLGAAPIRGTRLGGASEQMQVDVRVTTDTQ